MRSNYEVFENNDYELHVLNKNLKNYINTLKNLKANSDNNLDKHVLEAMIEIHEALIKVIAYKKTRELLLYNYLLASRGSRSLYSIDPLTPQSIFDLINYTSQIENEEIEKLKKIQKTALFFIFLQMLISTVLVVWSASMMIGLMFLALFIWDLVDVAQLVYSHEGLQMLKNAANPNDSRVFISKEFPVQVNGLTLFQLKNRFYNEENNNLLTLSLNQHRR